VFDVFLGMPGIQSCFRIDRNTPQRFACGMGDENMVRRCYVKCDIGMPVAGLLAIFATMSPLFRSERPEVIRELRRELFENLRNGDADMVRTEKRK